MLKTTENRRNHVPVNYVAKDTKDPKATERQKENMNLTTEESGLDGGYKMSIFAQLRNKNKLEPVSRKPSSETDWYYEFRW